MTSRRRRLSDLVGDRQGAASTEYVALLGTVGIVIAAAIVGLGPPLVHAYERTRAVLVSPTP